MHKEKLMARTPNTTRDFLLLVKVDDYHSLRTIAESVVHAKTVKHFEVAFDGDYWGVIYTGKRPPKKDLLKAARKAGYTEEDAAICQWGHCNEPALGYVNDFDDGENCAKHTTP
jgi:hypothetical protein